MIAQVRVSGPPNSSFIIGYPGISATAPRIEGKVEIRPSLGSTAPILVSLVTICLQRRETIHPAAESMTKHLSAPRKEIIDTVGRETLLYRSQSGREYDSILAMDLPFVIFLPFGRGREDMAQRMPPASLQLPYRTAETYYELVVSVQQGPQEQKKERFPIPISRYDTLSTFGMYSRVQTKENVSDHLVTLSTALPRWSYGPLDPITVYVKLLPNPDWLNKAKKVTIKSITVGIEEEVVYNHEGDEPVHKVKMLAASTHKIGVKLPEQGYNIDLGLVFPSKDVRGSDGIIPRGRKEFPTYMVTGFTTTATLYRIEHYLMVKAQLSSAKDITLRQRIVVCPYDHAACKEEMEAIEQSVKDAAYVSQENPMVPAPQITKAGDPDGLKALGITVVGGQRKPLIE